MSARYYNDNIGSNAPTMACPVSPPSDFTVVPGGGDTTLSAYKNHSGGFDF